MIANCKPGIPVFADLTWFASKTNRCKNHKGNINKNTRLLQEVIKCIRSLCYGKPHQRPNEANQVCMQIRGGWG